MCPQLVGRLESGAAANSYLGGFSNYSRIACSFNILLQFLRHASVILGYIRLPKEDVQAVVEWGKRLQKLKGQQGKRGIC